MQTVTEKPLAHTLHSEKRTITLGENNRVEVELEIACFPLHFTKSGAARTNTIEIGAKIGASTGLQVLHLKTAKSLPLKSPLSKIDAKILEDRVQRAIQEAASQYILDTPELSKGVLAQVLWFDKSRGEGQMCIASIQSIMTVYSCNIKGAKTCFPETACMYLEKGDQVTVDLVGDIHQIFVNVTSGGRFDAEKWASLDQSKLAFKKNEDGEILSGLFTR